MFDKDLKELKEKIGDEEFKRRLIRLRAKLIKWKLYDHIFQQISKDCGLEW